MNIRDTRLRMIVMCIRIALYGVDYRKLIA